VEETDGEFDGLAISGGVVRFIDVFELFDARTG
jgi:hypothetical protein